jgi:hypothetical protein
VGTEPVTERRDGLDELELVAAALGRLGLGFQFTSSGIRGACPLCASVEAHDRDDALSAALGDSRLLLKCFRCDAGFRALAGALGLNGRTPAFPPEEVRRRRAERDRREVKERRCLREQLDRAAASPNLEAALEHAYRYLFANVAELRRLRVGEWSGRLWIPILDDDGAIIGIDRYAMPKSKARLEVELDGVPKTRALGRRGLWPRPKDVGPGRLLPDWLLLVEGAPCAITLIGIGFAVLSYPSASGLNRQDTARIAGLLRGSGKHVLLLPDADVYGRRGASTSGLLLRSAGVFAHLVHLHPRRGDGIDAADVVRTWPRETAGRRFAELLDAFL